MLVDSHCHLDDPLFTEDRDAVVERAMANGVTKLLSIGTGEGLPDLQSGIRMAERYDAVFATVGVHPQYAPDARDEHFETLRRLLSHPKTVGIGEIGLDYHWKPYDAGVQAHVFARQLEVARDARKPLTIHTREAWDDTFALLAKHWAGSGLPCILHCFTGGPAEVTRGMSLGCYFSFAGVVTYPKAVEVHAAAKLVPLDKLLIETDAPYLPPVPHRGKRNEPAHLIHTARRLSELRSETLDDICSATTANFHRVFFASGDTAS